MDDIKSLPKKYKPSLSLPKCLNPDDPTEVELHKKLCDFLEKLPLDWLSLLPEEIDKQAELIFKDQPDLYALAIQLPEIQK